MLRIQLKCILRKLSFIPYYFPLHPVTAGNDFYLYILLFPLPVRLFKFIRDILSPYRSVELMPRWGEGLRSLPRLFHDISFFSFTLIKFYLSILWLVGSKILQSEIPVLLHWSWHCICWNLINHLSLRNAYCVCVFLTSGRKVCLYLFKGIFKGFLT